MTIDKSIPTSQERLPTLAPREGSRQCPYCALDRWVPAGMSFASNEPGPLSHFLGVWELHQASAENGDAVEGGCTGNADPGRHDRGGRIDIAG